MKFTINPDVLKEFEYIIELHQGHGAANPMATVSDLIDYVLASVADGSRRPGAWERQMLDMMGLVADCDEHTEYRSYYGESP